MRWEDYSSHNLETILIQIAKLVQIPKFYTTLQVTSINNIVKYITLREPGFGLERLRLAQLLGPMHKKHHHAFSPARKPPFCKLLAIFSYRLKSPRPTSGSAQHITLSLSNSSSESTNPITVHGEHIANKGVSFKLLVRRANLNSSVFWHSLLELTRKEKYYCSILKFTLNVLLISVRMLTILYNHNH